MRPVYLAGLLGAAALPALAQSNVTLGGILDVAVRGVHNEDLGTARSMVSGSNATSRLFFRGTESLGGDLSAGFHLEHGIQVDTGSANGGSQFWDRRSTVSLMSKSLGEIRAGRDYVPTYSNWSRFDPFSYVGVAGSNNLVSASALGPIGAAFGSNANTTVRSSNAVQLLLPAGLLGGLEGGLMAAPGEGGTAANGQARLVGGRLGYAAGPVVVSAAITTSRNDLTVAGQFKDRALAGSYEVGPVTLSAGWRRFDYADAAQTNLLVGAVLDIGPGEIKASWNRARLSGSVGAPIGDNGARQWGLGYVHKLSKRTALYATLSRLDNDGAATFVVPGGPSGLAGGAASTGYEAGLRHNF